MRDRTDKKIFFGNRKHIKDHSNMHRIWFKGKFVGRIRIISSLAEELLTLSGRKKYKRQIKSVVEWADDNKAKVVLFGASTKRLVDDALKLKEQYPKILFTIGDNGTVLLLKKESLKLIEICKLNPKEHKILIIGPYGFLGEAMTQTLLEQGFNIVGIGSNPAGIKRIQDKYNISIYEDYRSIGKVDAVMACTHSETIRLTSNNIDLIRHTNKKLLVIDVSEPSNLVKAEYQKCKDRVLRIDAGNAWSKNIKYILGFISYKMLRLQNHVTFGCFAESLVLAAELRNGNQELFNYNWFDINNSNMELIEQLFEKYEVTNPSFRCFGKAIKNFDLNLSNQ